MNRYLDIEPTATQLRAALSSPDAPYEIEDGAIVERPDPDALGRAVRHRLFDALADFLAPRRREIAFTGYFFVLDAARPLARKPAVAVVSPDRWDFSEPIPPRGDMVVAPDLIVEVVAPDQTVLDVSLRQRDYFRLGVRQVWWADPSNRLIVAYRSRKRGEIYEDSDVMDGGDVLPGFRLPVGPIFRPTPEE